MNCKKALARLSAFQDGELAPRQAQEIARHLERCTACRSELEAMDRLLDGLRRLASPLPLPGLASRIMAGLRTRPERKYRLLPSLAYTLALLAIFVGGFVLEMSVDGQQDIAAQSASTFSSVLAESRNLGLLAVHDSTLGLLSNVKQISLVKKQDNLLSKSLILRSKVGGDAHEE